MALAIVPSNNSSESSPFDSIRRFDEQGKECWYGRELMVLLGYQKWQRFQDTVERSKISCQNSGYNESDHFTHLPGSVSGSGRTGDNYKLSRHACHLIAMNGDPRKTEIASAQSYFSVKTREAEVVIPQQNDRLRMLELENENLRLKANMLDRADMLRLTAPAIAEAIICPGVTVIEKVEHIDRTVIMDGSGRVVSQMDGIGITAIQKQFGFKTTKQAWDWLDTVGYGRFSGQWQDEMTAHSTAKLPRHVLTDLKAKFAQHKGDRQRLIGE